MTIKFPDFLSTNKEEFTIKTPILTLKVRRSSDRDLAITVFVYGFHVGSMRIPAVFLGELDKLSRLEDNGA